MTPSQGNTFFFCSSQQLPSLRLTVSSCIDLFKFPSQKQERKGGWGPSFVSNLTLSFRVLIRPYWPGQVYSLIKDTQIDLDYKNQNVRGRQALKKGQSLIFMYCSQHFCTILRNLVYCFCAFEFKHPKTMQQLMKYLFVTALSYAEAPIKVTHRYFPNINVTPTRWIQAISDESF